MSPAVSLPKSVHRVTSRGKEYYYYQSGRGTPAQGPRITLPKDPHSPEFWAIPRAPGPYLRQSHGKVYSRKLLDKQFNEARARIPELAGATFHGLRGTRVVELRRAGLTPLQIQDQVGMSIAMIERYCRYADKKLSGKASVVALAERRNTK